MTDDAPPQTPKTPRSRRKAVPKDTRQIEFDILFDALPDISLRDSRDAMERPLVSLSKNIRFDQVEYRFGDLFLRIKPHQDFGRPTIWDYDVIIWLLGQVNERIKRERDDKPPPGMKLVKTVTEDGTEAYANVPAWSWEKPAIEVNPGDLLRGIRRVAPGKHGSGAQYADLRATIGRLQTCVIETNIWNGRKLKRFKRFTLIHDFEEQEPGEASSGGMRFVLPDWMVDSIANRKGILSVHPDYFALNGGIERFLYRIARKFAGRQDAGVMMKMSTLFEKSGSPGRLADFAKLVRKAVTEKRIPEYVISIDVFGGEERVRMVWNRGLISDSPPSTGARPSGSEVTNGTVIDAEFTEVGRAQGELRLGSEVTNDHPLEDAGQLDDEGAGEVIDDDQPLEKIGE